MKTLFAIITILGLVSVGICDSTKKLVSNEGIVKSIRAPQKLEFMGDSYEARYSASDKSKAIVEYYLPAESPKSWTRMLALRLNEAGPSSLEQITNMVLTLRASGSAAVASYKRKDTVGYGIDFMITTPGYQELNVFRYVDRTNAAGSVSFQYAQVIDQETVRGLETSKLTEYYTNQRINAIKAMWAIPVPTIEKLP
jgi:hypothetical protein